MNPTSTPLRPGRTAVIAIYLTFAAEVARTLTSPKVGNLAARYVALFLLFLVLLTVVLFRPGIRPALLHVYFAIQSALTLALLSLNPQLDLITALFAVLSYQVPLVFTGTTRWVWVGILALLSPGSLLFYLGLRGLALGLVPMAVGLILAAYAAVVQETEKARLKSQVLLSELEESHRQLQAHANQVEELAAVEERIRLAASCTIRSRRPCSVSPSPPGRLKSSCSATRPVFGANFSSFKR